LPNAKASWLGDGDGLDVADDDRDGLDDPDEQLAKTVATVNTTDTRQSPNR